MKRADRRCQGSPVEVPRGRERKAFFWTTELCGRVGAPPESMERGREGGGKQTRRDHKASFSGSVADSHHHHHHHIIKASRLDSPHPKNGSDSNRNSPPAIRIPPFIHPSNDMCSTRSNPPSSPCKQSAPFQTPHPCSPFSSIPSSTFIDIISALLSATSPPRVHVSAFVLLIPIHPHSLS